MQPPLHDANAFSALQTTRDEFGERGEDLSELRVSELVSYSSFHLWISTGLREH